MRARFTRFLAVTVLLSAMVPVWAADTPHGVYTPETLKWGDPPPFVPKGAKVAVVYGDPTKEGLFIIQVQMPANYRIPAHSHPTDEVITVLRGTVFFGTGDKFEPQAAKPLSSASMVVAPAKMNHFLLTKDPARIQVVGTGPLVFTYVNPAEDPSRK